MIGKKIFLDYGHGGVQFGAVYNGLAEKHLNLQLGELILNELESASGAQSMLFRSHPEDLSVLDNAVILTRRTDVTVPLYRRIASINRLHQEIGIDLVVSVHHNAAHRLYRGKSRGFKVYHYASNRLTRAISDRICSAVRTMPCGEWSLSERKDQFDLGRKVDILHKTKPSSVLIESGYLDNWEDAKLITDVTHQRITAAAIARAIVVFFNEQQERK